MRHVRNMLKKCRIRTDEDRKDRKETFRIEIENFKIS